MSYAWLSGLRQHLEGALNSVDRRIEHISGIESVHHVGAEKPSTALELAKMVSRTVGAELNIRHLLAQSEVAHAHSIHEKIRAQFGDLLTHAAMEESIGLIADWAWR